MKNCKIKDGKLICEEDILGLFHQTTEFGAVSPIGTVSVKQPLKLPIKLPSLARSPISDTEPDDPYPIAREFDKLLKTIPEKHRSDVKDIFHPILGNHITQPNVESVPQLVREKAILAEASREYFESNRNQEHVDEYLKENGIGNKYRIDYEASNNDGLTAVNKKTGKATLAFRGTSPSNLRDWRENVDYVTKDWKIHPMKTIYGKRIHEFYENASSIHEIEHLTGFSKGAFGAIALGDAVGIETTTFSPAVTAGHIRTSKSVKHNIWNTTEDMVSVLANPLKIKNKNVKVNTIRPLEEFDSFFPASTHDIHNYIRNGPRGESRSHKLALDSVKSGKLQAELEHARVAQDMVDLKMNYTDYVRQMNPNDVNKLDDTFSTRIQRNDLLHKTWKDMGGQFTRVESEQLTRANESDVKLVTTKTQRIDFANQPKHMQVKQRIEMQKAHTDLHEEIAKVASENPLHQKNVIRASASHIPRAGVSMAAAGLVGNTLSFMVGEEDLLLKKVLPTEIVNDITDVKDFIKPVTDIIPKPVKQEVSPIGMGATAAAITGGSIVSEGVAPAVIAYEGAKGIGQGAKHIAKLSGASEELQEHVDIVSEGLSAPGLFFGALRGISSGLRAASLVEAVTPIPGMRLLAGMSLASAGIAEGLNYMFSGEEQAPQETTQSDTVPN